MDKDRIIEQKKDFIEKSKPYEGDETISDLSNSFRAFAKRGKANKSAKVLFFLEFTLPKLIEEGCKVNEFNVNSFRITDGINVIDFYPSSGKVFTKDKKYKQLTNNPLKSLLNYLKA